MHGTIHCTCTHTLVCSHEVGDASDVYTYIHVEYVLLQLSVSFWWGEGEERQEDSQPAAS